MFRKWHLLICVISSMLLNSHTLHAMETPLLPFNAWKTCFKIINKFSIPKDLTAHIFSFYTIHLWADCIAQDCDHPRSLLNGIEKLVHYGLPCYRETSFRLGLKQTNTSLINLIGFSGSNTVLHHAAIQNEKDVVWFLATLPEAQTLSLKRNSSGYTALHEALSLKKIDHEMITLLLDAAGDKAWKLINKPVKKNGRSAWAVANLEIKKIMDRYRPDASESSSEEDDIPDNSCIIS